MKPWDVHDEVARQLVLHSPTNDFRTVLYKGVDATGLSLEQFCQKLTPKQTQRLLVAACKLSDNQYAFAEEMVAVYGALLKDIGRRWDDEIEELQFEIEVRDDELDDMADRGGGGSLLSHLVAGGIGYLIGKRGK
jgi:hypothetical protein